MQIEKQFLFLTHRCVGVSAQPLEIALLLTSSTRLAGFTRNGRGSLINRAYEVIKITPQPTYTEAEQHSTIQGDAADLAYEEGGTVADVKDFLLLQYICS